MRKCLLLLLFCVTFLSCKKDKDAEPSELITGFRLIDASGNMIGDVGTPNEKNFADASINISVFPNPLAQYIFVYMQATKPTRISIWLTHAILSTALSNSPYYVASSETPGKVAMEVTKDSEVQGSSPFQLDMSGLPAGPYRIYFKVGEEVSWKNVIIKR
ncbi:hypothetical protein [Rufibacter latericius]|uniref:Uncharacterized protein n=1 Tax=Rufibacter latericius TaxID=2487040 RepID=A0A3M9MA15_9BACT|nr:hypothetical protein [Rufibacter latericius]RNI22055.1 hypothetical protein EFB08_23265 [Rufibacter latericius]